MKLSIIIVNYNSGEFLSSCLASLREFIALSNDKEVFVVDNNSNDGSPSKVTRDFPWVKLIINHTNLGFAKANNQALRLAKGEYVLLLNPDTEVPADTLPKVLEFMEKREEIAALTCRVELGDGSLDPACHRGFPTPWASFCYFTGLEKLFPKSRLFGKYHMTWCDLEKPHEIDSPSGCFFLIRRKILEEVGFLDEDYFLYGEDMDLAFRIKEKGFKIFFYPEAKIIHYKGISSGVKKATAHLTTATAETRRLAIKSFFRANRLFYQKHLAHRYPFIINWFTYLGIWLLEKKSLLGKRI
jgi:GT2 family glycosyltransferase